MGKAKWQSGNIIADVLCKPASCAHRSSRTCHAILAQKFHLQELKFYSYKLKFYS